MVEQDVASLTQASAVVARARVRSSQARWTRDGARIVTDTELEVLEAWKGAPAPRVVVMQPGGVVGDIGQKVAGAAQFAAGEEVVVFLEPRGDRYTVAGMSQGAFHVERSSDGRTAYARQSLDEALLLDPVTRQPLAGPREILTVAQLRARVLAATPVAPPPGTPPTTPRPVAP